MAIKRYPTILEDSKLEPHHQTQLSIISKISILGSDVPFDGNVFNKKNEFIFF